MNTPLGTNLLIPLKAFFVGFSLKRHHDQIKVAETIDDAINQFSDTNGLQQRKAFYLLIKCEITRDIEGSIDNREIAKRYCEENNIKDLFETYMHIVDKTNYAYERVDSSGKGSVDSGYYLKNLDIHQDAILSVYGIVNSGYQNYFNDHEGYPVNVHTEANTYLTKKDYNFLFNVTLKEILDKHFR